MNAIDTNIWMYSHDSRDIRKQEIARRLIDDLTPLALLWQVGCEFISASKKLAPLGFSEEHAWNSLGKMCNMADAIIMPTPDLWIQTRRLQMNLSVNFWDALIVAACLQRNVSTFYSEDFSHRQKIDRLEIINPFV
jgi:predicted nucleic acid-binding protein